MRLSVVFCLLVLFSGVLLAQEAEVSAKGEPFRVHLKEAITLALKNNLDIQIESFNPEIQQTSVDFEESRFEPFFGANINTTDSTNPTGSILVGEDAITSENLTYNFNLVQKLQTGTSYSVTFDNSRVETNQSFTSVNPRFDSTLFANVTQPLMRDFGIDITKTPMQIATENRIASDHRLRQRMMDIALQVEQAYWLLVFFYRNLDVRKQSLALAQELYENNKKQVEVGTMAPLEIVTAEAEVAAREEGIITTENLIANTEDILRNLVLSEKNKDKWNTQFIPVDEPGLTPLNMTEDEAIQRAMENNPDLKALKSDVESRKLSTKLASNALKPQLDLKASIGFAGLGGDTLLLDDSTFPPQVIGTVPGSYGDALSSMFDNNTWSVGFVVGIPIGNQGREADYVRADLSQKQMTRILDSTREQLILNVRTAVRNLQSDMKRYDATRASRTLQERKLDAEKKKLAVGLSTNYIVLDYQDDLAEAQSSELRAIVDYERNLAQLDRYLGAILP